VHPGEIVVIVGPNGAGKSTTLKVLAGLLRARQGSVSYDGRPALGLRPSELVKRGLVLCPEGRELFPDMTVLENLHLGAHIRAAARTEISASLDDVFELFPILSDRSSQRAGTLSGGEQQMLAIGRALMAKPKLLMLDEPSLGLAPLLVAQMFALIRDIKDRGTSILLVEQNVVASLGVADRGYVLETGRIVATDQADRLLKDERLQEAYFGGLSA
jgi:branched-chain amino acid transport system ATP-binding protein